MPRNIKPMRKDLSVPHHTTFDGVIQSEYKMQPSEGVLYRQMTQPERPLILNRNAELRKNPGVINDLSFGRQMLSIPEIDYIALCRKYPVLVNGSNKEIEIFYKKFIKSSESLPFRVQA